MLQMSNIGMQLLQLNDKLTKLRNLNDKTYLGFFISFSNHLKVIGGSFKIILNSFFFKSLISNIYLKLRFGWGIKSILI